MSVPLLNNMAKASEQLNPGIRTVREWLQEQPGVCNAMMSGSGAAVFAVCDSFASAAKVATDAQAKGWWAAPPRSVPLRRRLPRIARQTVQRRGFQRGDVVYAVSKGGHPVLGDLDIARNSDCDLQRSAIFKVA